MVPCGDGGVCRLLYDVHQMMSLWSVYRCDSRSSWPQPMGSGGDVAPCKVTTWIAFFSSRHKCCCRVACSVCRCKVCNRTAVTTGSRVQTVISTVIQQTACAALRKVALQAHEWVVARRVVNLQQVRSGSRERSRGGQRLQGQQSGSTTQDTRAPPQARPTQELAGDVRETAFATGKPQVLFFFDTAGVFTHSCVALRRVGARGATVQAVWTSMARCPRSWCGPDGEVSEVAKLFRASLLSCLSSSSVGCLWLCRCCHRACVTASANLAASLLSADCPEHESSNSDGLETGHKSQGRLLPPGAGIRHCREHHFERKQHGLFLFQRQVHAEHRAGVRASV